MIKFKLLLTLFVASTMSLFAQNITELRGNIVDRATDEPLSGVTVILKDQRQRTTTDSKGQFYFENVSAGKDLLMINGATVIPTEIPVTIEVNSTALLKNIRVTTRMEEDMSAAFSGVIDDAVIDDEGSTQEIKSAIITSNDVFLRTAGFQLSQFRFKNRGYDNIYEGVYINGVNFNTQDRGVFNYSSIGALNDITRNGDKVNYLSPNTFTYGMIGGSENINMRAGSMPRRGSVTGSFANRAYYVRGMATLSSGLMDNGFAYTVSVGGRYSDEGMVQKGTSYRNISYAVLLEKQWAGGNHSLSFSTFGSPVERGQAGHSTQEVYDLVGSNQYNPNWGYQDGKKRNSKMVRSFDPTGILSYVWKINRTSKLNVGYGLHYQYDRRTALNWYEGKDPRPDYYRKLPSYYDMMGQTEVGDLYRDLWSSKDSKITQLDWEEMYEANRIGQRRANGDPNSAIYMVEGRRNDLWENAFNATLNLDWQTNQTLTMGLEGKSTSSRSFKEVVDLMGSQYVVDIDKYAERDFGGDSGNKQNDLRNPDRKAKKGDTFGYDYTMNIYSTKFWLQNEFRSAKIDAYYGFRTEFTNFSRKGAMQNGRYAEESYGRGKQHNFLDFGIKGGLNYKFTGRDYLMANINIGTQAPLIENAYISPRIWDKTIDDLKSSKIISADMSYVWSQPKFRGRVTLFQTYFLDKVKKVSYYHDAARTYMHHVMNGLNSIHRGIELGTAYQLNNNWSFDLAGTIAEYYYTSNPNGTLHYENGANPPMDEKVYLKDSYVGGTPQFAGTFKVNYFNNFWFLSLAANAVGRNYVDVAPIRRLQSTYTEGDKPINPANPAQVEAFKQLTAQERFGSSYTLDFSIGKLFYLPNKHSLNINVTANNILNRTNVKTGGYQQGRVDLEKPAKYANKYFYMQGINCFINVSYRFKLN